MSDQETKNPLDELDNDQSDPSQANDGAPTEPSQDDPAGAGAPAAPETPQQPTEPAATPTQPETVAETPVTPAPSVEKTDQPDLSHVAPGEPRAGGLPVAARQSDSGIKYYFTQRHKATKERLEKQPKVLFIIPKVDGEAAGLAYDTVQIDGFRMEIRKGVAVTIPEQVANILAEKYRIGTEAGQEHLINRDEKTSEVLG